jgi:hypothetical protein
MQIWYQNPAGENGESSDTSKDEDNGYDNDDDVEEDEQ